MLENLELTGTRKPANEDDIELLHPLEEEDDIQQFHEENREELWNPLIWCLTLSIDFLFRFLVMSRTELQ